MTYDVGLIIDGLILVFLGVTIFYAARLSLFMKSFRESRVAIQSLIRDLSITIDKAENSIGSLKKEAVQVERSVLEVLSESKFIADELKFMNSAGDNLAGRLEKLADRNKELVDLMSKSGGIGHMVFDGEVAPRSSKTNPVKPKKKIIEEELFEIDDFALDADEDDEYDFHALEDGAYEEKKRPSVNTESKSKVRSFAIFDKEFVLSDDGDDQDDLEIDDDCFRSKAERDLYEALQRKKRVSEIS